MDPVLAKRDQVRKLVSGALRVGYGSYAVAFIAFFFGVFTDSLAQVASAISVLLIVGSILLAPAMTFKYALKAADRADREQSW